MRAVFETLGMQDVVAKSLGSSNPYNLVRATFDALKNEDSPRSVAARRGLKVSTLQARRRDASTPTAPAPKREGGDMAKMAAAATTVTVEQIGSPIRRDASQRADAGRPRPQQAPSPLDPATTPLRCAA